MVVVCSAEGSFLSSQPSTRSALVAVRVFRRVSAWALPRPSAMDSARLAKTTVSHSQTAMTAENPVGTRPSVMWVNGSMTATIVVRAAPTHTRNMTGLRHWARGSSLRKAPGKAWRTWAPVRPREREFEVMTVMIRSVLRPAVPV